MAKTRKQPKADSGNGFISEDERRLAEQLRTVRERQKQALNLQRVNIFANNVTSRPPRRPRGRADPDRRADSGNGLANPEFSPSAATLRGERAKSWPVAPG